MPSSEPLDELEQSIESDLVVTKYKTCGALLNSKS